MNPFNALSALALVIMLLPVGCGSDVGFTGTSADQRKPEVILDQEFATSLRASNELLYRADFGLVEQTLTLKEKPPVTATLRQSEREEKAQPFTQGNDGEPGDQELEISSLGKVDLLVVLDNSGTMGDENAKLKVEFDSLTDKLKKTNWRIAVTTTDNRLLYQRCTIIDKADADPQAAFRKAIENAGTGGDANEQGIAQAHWALQPNTTKCLRNGQTWWRADAQLAMLFVSDEEDHSPMTPAQFVAAVDALRPNVLVKTYALLWEFNPAKGCTYSSSSQEEQAGTEYKAIVNTYATRPGQEYDGGSSLLCEPSYAGFLDGIAAKVAKDVKREFELAAVPELRTLKFMMTDEDGNTKEFTDYDLTGKKVKLTKIGDKDKKLNITYRFDVKPKFDRVSLEEPVAADTLEVKVDGQKLDAADYSYDDATQMLTFAAQPANNADVRVRFRKKGDLPKTFDVRSLGLIDAPLEVKVGDAVVGAYQFDGMTGELSFTDAPTDGAAISVAYKPADARITRYAAAVAAPDQVRNGLRAQDALTGEIVVVNVDGQEIVFDEAEIVAGRELLVTYDYGNSNDELTHDVPQDPISGTLIVEDVNKCIRDVALTDKTVTFKCDGKALGDVTIKYDYIAERYRSFTVPVATDGFVSHWQVFVDGQAVQFKQEGSVVTVEDKYFTSDDAKVRIVVVKL